MLGSLTISPPGCVDRYMQKNVTKTMVDQAKGLLTNPIEPKADGALALPVSLSQMVP